MFKTNCLKRGLRAFVCLGLIAGLMTGCGSTSATTAPSTDSQEENVTEMGTTINTASTLAASLNSNIRFGSGRLSGYYYPYANAIAEAAADYPIEVKTSAGSVSNLRLINDDYVQLAFVQSDSVFNAWNGLEEFENTPARNYGAVARLYTEPVHIVVAADSPIQSVADLRGKSVSIGEEQSGVIHNAEDVLMAYGMDFTDIDARHLSFSDSAKAFSKGEIDAFFITACYPVPAIGEVTKPVKLLSIGEEELAWIKKWNGYYDTFTIPAGTYEGQTEDAVTVGVGAIVLASNTLPDEDVANLTAIITENNAELAAKAGLETSLTVQECAEGVPVVFHPGARAYYERQGITVN